MSSGLPSSDLPSTVDASARSARTASTRPGQSAGSTPTGDGPVFATEMKEALTVGAGSATPAVNTTAEPVSATPVGPVLPAQGAAQAGLNAQATSKKATAPGAAVAGTASKRVAADAPKADDDPVSSTAAEPTAAADPQPTPVPLAQVQTLQLP